MYRVKNFIFIIPIILFYSCVGNSPGVSNENNNYNKIINMYSGEYFIGVGTGKGSTKEMAIKIAKARALGELGYQSTNDGDSWDAIPDEGYIKDSDHSPECSLITPSQYIFIGTWNSGIIRTAAPVNFGN